MAVYYIDPITDPRWQELIERHPDASVFHAPAWLKALRDTYRFRNLALTTAAPGEQLRNGIVMSEIRSWITGTRGVSLPFSDHCQPLFDREEDMVELATYLPRLAAQRSYDYVEIRLHHSLPSASNSFYPLHEAESFCFHALDLTRTEAQLYGGLHKSAVRSLIQKAARENLRIEQGQSEESLSVFYRLLLLTRRRHHLPPQPLHWFQNLREQFGNDLVFWTAHKGDQPVAAILTLAFKDTVVYKYGCSDSDYHSLGGIQALLWQAILYARERNAHVYDMGRSDPMNQGLITFKDRWGAQRHALTYLRATRQARVDRRRGSQKTVMAQFAEGCARQVVPHLPDLWLTTAGRLLYRHMA